ncbi:hypothetical protein AAE026_24825 [Bradyrhizobium sp. DN5]|uniref:hypothetical protein n=1 Tax=Bradyrhizobium sp. DN5 TaxID=3056950 RepID=UPI0035236DE4
MRRLTLVATLDDLQKQWPDFDSADTHLLYARALAESGRIDEALEEYHALAGYFPVPKRGCVTACCCRWSAVPREARMVFDELLIQMRRAPKYLRKAQAEWLSIAEKQLST